MYRRVVSAVFALSFLAAGCSIHPTQSEVTGLPTYLLVDRIRCETRLAIQDTAIEMLREHGNELLAKDLADDRSAFMGDVRSRLSPREAAFYDRYINTGIAFDFTFDILEDNKSVLAANPVSLITNGMLSVGVNSTSEFSRHNTRKFLVSDRFAEILRNPRLKCSDRYEYKNYVYPIAGEIGMRELISTFIHLNEDTALDKDPKADAHVFADTLVFMTMFNGSVSPTVQITPVGRRVGLNSSSETASASRTDMHQLIIGLSMDAKAAPPVAVLAPVVGRPLLSTAFAKSNVASPNEQRAIDATVQQRLDSFLDRFGRGF